MTRRRMRKRHPSAMHHSAVAHGAAPAYDQERTGPSSARQGAMPAPAWGGTAPAKASPLDFAATSGLWSVAYAPDAGVIPEAGPQDHLPHAPAEPAGQPTAALPRAPGLADSVEALALAMWNDGRRTEAAAFVERQLALAKEAAEPAADVFPPEVPAPESNSLPAVVPAAALMAASRSASSSPRWPAARTLGIGIAAALLLATGAGFLIASEKAAEPVRLLAAAEGQGAPDGASAPATGLARPESPQGEVPALAEAARGEDAGAAEMSIAAVDAGAAEPDPAETPAVVEHDAAATPVTAEPPPEPAAEPALAAEPIEPEPRLARPAEPALPSAAAGQADFDALFSGDALRAAPLQSPAPPETGLARLQPPAETPDAPGAEAPDDAFANSATAPDGPAGTEAAETSVAAVDVDVMESAPAEAMADGGPPPEVIYEDFTLQVPAEASAEPALPLEAAPPIPDPRLPKARPDVAVATAPANSEPQAAGADSDRPVLLGRPRGPMSARLAERRAAAEQYAARRRAVAEWRARRGLVLMGPPGY